MLFILINSTHTTPKLIISDQIIIAFNTNNQYLYSTKIKYFLVITINDIIALIYGYGGILHKIEYESLHKLALVLLPIFVTSIGYISIQIYNTGESLNKFPMIIEKQKNENKNITREVELISDITNILENSRKRINPNKTPDYYIEKARHSNGIQELTLMQVELNDDIGKLHQYQDKMYYFINDMAYSINNILDIESNFFSKLQKFVDIHIDKPVTKIDKEKYYQEVLDTYFETIKALSKHKSTNKIILEKSRRLQNQQSLVLQGLIKELDNISSTLTIYLILFIMNFIVLILLLSITIKQPHGIYNKICN